MSGACAPIDFELRPLACGPHAAKLAGSPAPKRGSRHDLSTIAAFAPCRMHRRSGRRSDGDAPVAQCGMHFRGMQVALAGARVCRPTAASERRLCTSPLGSVGAQGDRKCAIASGAQGGRLCECPLCVCVCERGGCALCQHARRICNGAHALPRWPLSGLHAEVSSFRCKP